MLRVWLAAGLAAMALVACGGGGGGGYSDPGPAAGTTPAPAIRIVDSFGVELQAGDGGGVGAGDAGSDGTAGEGKPIVGGVVVITDLNGKSVSAVTDAQGYYRAKVTGFQPPFVAKVTKTDGKTLYSLNVKALKVNGFITVNITGLTDKIASDVARAGGKLGAGALTPQIVSANPGALTESLNQLRSTIAPVISAAGFTDPNSFDPLSTPFRPNGTGYDKVLDNVVVTVGADGQTQLVVSPTFSAPGSLTGTWTLTTAVAINQPGFPSIPPSVVDVPGSAVPKDAAAAANICQSGISQVVQTGSGSATVSCNGNVVTVVIPGSGTFSTTFATPSYQGCGACGVGSQVVVGINANVTVTIPGGPSQSYSFTGTLTYVRKS
ncbi:MAG: hypothetical protein NVS3B2_01420 [Ramlibacter sp.]